MCFWHRNFQHFFSPSIFDADIVLSVRNSGHVVVSVRENFDADPAWMKLGA
jgi:hypothetical protein